MSIFFSPENKKYSYKAFEFSYLKKFHLNHFNVLKTLAVIKIESGASSPSCGVLKPTLSDVDLISSPDREFDCK